MKVLVSVLQAIEDFEELCRLFARLHVTLFCALDSVNVEVQTHVKILLTSPTDTDTIRAAFKEKDVLSMFGQPRGDKRFDDDRLAQHVGGALGRQRH
ncbi:hypothetical protein F4823DRAFT_565285 [Ustulina deusta]|nr:hypothetical protein F4823DRAFT_565285 [Ustulina deusta]